MDEIREFPLDHWVRAHKSSCSVTLQSSSAKPVSLRELGRLSDDAESTPFSDELVLDYGKFEGSEKLRTHIAELNSTAGTALTAKDVIATPGSIMANYLVLRTLCKRGDHVICQYPTYGQLYILPRNDGVDVTLWAMKEDNGWLPDLSVLEGMIKPNTKAIILNNPNNPTGVVLSRGFLEKVISVAKARGIYVFCDEVFAPLFHKDSPDSSPIVSFGYDKTISTGSLSKAFGLPGIRVGWVLSRDASFLRRLLVARDYTTISISQLDDSVAAYALSPQVRSSLMQRNLELCRESIDILDHFVQQNPRCRWTKPQGGGTAFLQVLGQNQEPVEDESFALQATKSHGLLLVPCGLCFRDEGTEDFRGYFRLSIGNPEALKKGLSLLQGVLLIEQS